MRAIALGILVGTGVTAMAAAALSDPLDTPSKYVTIDQNVDQAILARYHYTDQGTRLIPAAWLAAVEMPDGSGKVMSSDNLRRYGFLVDNVSTGPNNPYGWPVGFMATEPAKTGGIAIAGFTCAMCHTGQIEYKGTAIRIEGGQAMTDLFPFVDEVAAAFIATATDAGMRKKFFADAVAAGYPADRMEKDFDGAVSHFSELGSSQPGKKITILAGGRGRVDAVQGIANRVFGTDIMMPQNQQDMDAPVSYPHLWDIWRLSWLQYNGFIPPLSTARNIGETLGTEGITHIVDAEGNLNPLPLRWQTSVQLNNIIWIEGTLQQLHAPTWPAEVLGPIDPAKAAKGLQLFTEHCAGCHGIKELPNGQWDVAIVPLNTIGTDPNQATNWAKRTYDASILGMSKDTHANVGLTAVINAVRKQLYADNNTPASEQEPDATLLAPCGYKARPLIGAWATPPFLHNGAVRTIYDMISDTRAAKFTYGTREYDPVKLGYTEDKSLDDAVMDTSIPGNSNEGHWWTDDMSRPGRIGPKLSEDDKYAILEYLKSATYENYPQEKRDMPAKVACQDDPDWAVNGTAPK